MPARRGNPKVGFPQEGGSAWRVEQAFDPSWPRKEDDNTARRPRRVVSNDDSELLGPSQGRFCLALPNEDPSRVLAATEIDIPSSRAHRCSERPIATHISFPRCLKVVDTFRAMDPRLIIPALNQLLITFRSKRSPRSILR
jgi:hypothetical protein